MSYFLKKTKKNKGLYLQIYKGDFDKERGHVVQKCHKSLGYVPELIEAGIDNPLEYYKEEVKKLNVKAKLEKFQKKSSVRMIEEASPIKSVGFFPLKIVMDRLCVKKYVDQFASVREFQFSVYEVLSALVYARVVSPCSKYATFHDVLPSMYGNYNFSYDQILSCCEFIGNDYEKFIEIFTEMTNKWYGIDTSTTFFDGTNFYFEIDKEDDFRRKGPSKENRHDPIIGMGLLLDGHSIPICMKLYPGNQSEKPVLRKIISEMKMKTGATGKTIQIADKGLNCAKNIHEAILNRDGYIFSKSIKMLSKTEQEWAIKDKEQFSIVCDSDGKEVYCYKEAVDDYTYQYTDEDDEIITFQVREKRIVTFNTALAKKQIAEIDKMYESAKKKCYSQAKKSECGPEAVFMDFIAKDGSKAQAVLNEKAYKRAKELAGFNMLVTSEYKAAQQEIYDAYHTLWRIEESFRVMKSDLDARPVFLQNENSIKGHFLICYIAVLLTRLLQFYDLRGEIGTPELMKFMKSFNLFTGDKKLVNATTRTKTIEKLAEALDIPLLNYFINPQILKMMHLD